MTARLASRKGDAHSDAVWALAWLSDNQFISGSVDGTVKMWQVSDKDVVEGPKWVMEGEFPMGVVSLARISTDLFAATSMDGCIRICSSATGKVVRKIEAGPVDCWAVCASDDGKQVASGTYTGAVNVWDVATGALVDTYETNSGFALAVAWKGNHLAVGTKDGGVFQIDTMTKDIQSTKAKVHHLPVRSLAYSRDGERLFTASDDGLSACITADGGEKIGVLKGHLSWVLGVATGHASIATACADRKVRVWDPDTKECLATFEAHTGQVFCLSYNPLSSLLASGGASGDIQLFAVAKAQS